MTIFEQVFCLYGRLDNRGVLLELKGKALADAPKAVIADIGKSFHQASFFRAGSGQSSKKSSNEGNAAVKAAVDACLAGDAGVSVVDVYFKSSAPARKVKLTFTAAGDIQTKTEDVLFVAEDITPYAKEADYYRQQSERLLYAAENAEIGLWFWDMDKKHIFTTPKLNEFFGFGPEEQMTPEKANKVIHPEDRPLRAAALERARKNHDHYDIEYRVVVGGETKWLRVSGKTFPGTGGAAPFMTGSAREITQQKVAEQEMENISRSEKKARDTIEEANKAKDQFIAMVSHELRGPLNSILGWVKILLTKEVDGKATITALETIERSARVQAKLINDLVDSSKIISGKLNLEFHPVNVVDALSFVIESQKPLAEAKNIRLRFFNKFKEVRVNADLGRIQQIFLNLVTNAIKFTPGGGEIALRVEREADNVVISVADNGKGIEKEALPYIFEQFFQARVSESDDKSGLGLGLSIVASLVRQHGGTVTANSNGAGKGATFIVSLPLVKASAQPAEQKEKAERENDNNMALRGLRILLVEDNDDSREVLEMFLAQLGASVISAESSARAMEKLREAQMIPHVLVSDISMPEEDGYSLMARIRRLPPEKGGSMPAIALTAFASAEDKRKTAAAGFQVHHVKPFEPEQLIKEILEVVR